MFVLHVRSNYISLVNTSLYIFTRGYATRENIASDVHSVKYITILHWNKQISSISYHLIQYIITTNYSKWQKHTIYNKQKIDVFFYKYGIYFHLVVWKLSYIMSGVHTNTKDNTKMSKPIFPLWSFVLVTWHRVALKIRY